MLKLTKNAVWVAVLIGLAGVLPSRAWAQQAPPESVEKMVADRYVALARMMMAQAVEEEQRDDLLMAIEILMDMALELEPKDAELWRLRGELAKQRDDAEDERKALAEYVALRPDDDAAQLEMVIMLIKAKQTDTLQQRVEKVERLLNSETGKKLSKPLQSRLASDIAGSDLETGDGKPDHGWLRYALRTDPTNYAAARMIYDIVAASDRPPLERALGLYGLLRANPVDSATHEALAELLLQQGAYRKAAEQYEVSRTFARVGAPSEVIHSWTLCMAASGDRERALQMIQELKIIQEQQDQRIADAKAAGTPLEPVPEIYTTELRLLSYCIRLAPGQMTHSADGPLRTIRKRLEADIAAGTADSEAKLAWVLVWFNVDQLVAESLVNKLAEQRGEEDVLVRRLRGWQALHKGDKAAARRLLEGIAGQDEFAAYGVAMLEAKRDDPRRLQWLQRAVDLSPQGLAGLLSARELLAAGSKPRPTPTGRSMLRMMDTWEFALIKPEPDVRPWVTIELSVEPKRGDFLQPLNATVRIRNMTDFPLAVGPNAPVPSNVFLYMSPRRGGRFAGRVPPLVVDMQRRLRIEPREVIETTVRIDRGYFPYSLPSIVVEKVVDEETGEETFVQRQEIVNLAAERISYTVTALLDPIMTADGRVVTGLMGATDSADLLEFGSGMAQVDPVNKRSPRIERWIAAVAEPDRNARADAIARLMSLAPKLIDDQTEDEEARDVIREFGTRMAEAVNTAYSKLDPISQAWAVMYLPDDKDDAKSFDQVINEAKSSDDPRVRIAFIVSQVEESTSDELADAIRSDNLRISEFARVYDVLLKRMEKLKKEQEEAAKAQDPLAPGQ